MSWIQKVHMKNFGWIKELVYWTLTKRRHVKHVVTATQQLAVHSAPWVSCSPLLWPVADVIQRGGSLWLSSALLVLTPSQGDLLHLTVCSTVQPSPATSPGFCSGWHSVLLHSAILPSLDPGSAWPSVCRQGAATLFILLPSIPTWPMAPLSMSDQKAIWMVLTLFHPDLTSGTVCFFYNHFLLHTFIIKHCSFLQFFFFSTIHF